MTISTLVLDETEGPQALELLIAHSGLQNLLQLLMVPDQEVRVAAAGALRNVSLAGTEAVAAKLVSLDCLTLLFEGILLPLGQTGGGQTNPEFLIHILSLLANLAEYDERVVQRFAGRLVALISGSNLFNPLVGLLLDPGTGPTTLLFLFDLPSPTLFLGLSFHPRNLAGWCANAGGCLPEYSDR
jgi:hypothetical protein